MNWRTTMPSNFAVHNESSKENIFTIPLTRIFIRTNTTTSSVRATTSMAEPMEGLRKMEPVPLSQQSRPMVMPQTM